MLEKIGTWDKLLKRILGSQLGEIKGKRILDFGSGLGITANHYAKENQVIAIEPSAERVNDRCKENVYEQIVGSLNELRQLEAESFDLIFCHNVLEYASEREEIVREFYRLLKPNGMLSVVKHNRPGRVMQMAVLLNDFTSANNLLDGKDGVTSKFGVIHYYEDSDITKWCKDFSCEKVYGIRVFWDLQQNQEIQETPEWQERMIQLEMRVSEIEEFRAIACSIAIIFVLVYVVMWLNDQRSAMLFNEKLKEFQKEHNQTASL